MVGRSLRQIVWARLRRDKVAMLCLGILVFLYAVAFIVPLVAKQLGIDPIKLHSDLISGLGGKPKGDSAASARSTSSGSSGARGATSSPSSCPASGSRCPSRPAQRS